MVDVYKRSTAIVPLSAIVALWSAGKGMQSIINGLNTIYHVKETRNWLLTRIYAVFYTLSLVIAVIVSLLMLVLGNEIQKVVSKIYSFSWKSSGKKYWGQEHCWYLVCCFWFFLCCIRFFRTEKPHSKARFPEP